MGKERYVWRGSSPKGYVKYVTLATERTGATQGSAPRGSGHAAGWLAVALRVLDHPRPPSLSHLSTVVCLSLVTLRPSSSLVQS